MSIMGKNEKNAIHNIDNNMNTRQKRVQRIKTMIISAVVTAILIPIVLCIVLMVRINKIEDKLEAISEAQGQEYEDYLDNSENKQSSSIVYAAEKEEDGQMEDSLDGDEAVFSEQSVKNPEDELSEVEKLDKNTDSKKVYLTFDDGPGKYTDQLLDVLAENDVKATFFVIGRTDEHSLEMYKRIVKEGHTLAMHSYSHQYSKIYASVKAFSKDMNKLSDLLYETTGVRPTMYRFPGGSSNTVSKIPMTKFIKYLNKNNITYYDWNVINGDATGKVLTSSQLIENVMDGVKKCNSSMVLMHDTAAKDTTIKSIPTLIKKLKKQGYTILPITKYTSAVQHIKADSVK